MISVQSSLAKGKERLFNKWWTKFYKNDKLPKSLLQLRESWYENKSKDKRHFLKYSRQTSSAQCGNDGKGRANVKARGKIQLNKMHNSRQNKLQKIFLAWRHRFSFCYGWFFHLKNINTNKVDHLIESSFIRGEPWFSEIKQLDFCFDKNQNIESVISSHWIKTNEDSFASIVFSNQSELRINQNPS